MKYHRINGEIQPAPSSTLGADAGTPADTPSVQLLLKVLEANPPDATDASRRALPLQPRSYRDFMLFEAHYHGAALGMTQLFAPTYNWIGRTWEAIVGPFPAFKPHRLWYHQPIFYQSNHLAFVSDGASVPYPKYATYLDVELELGVVLGKTLYNATPEEAEEAIAGFCVFNDFSVRNLQMEEMSR
jgi:hypothetical protein